MGISENIQRIKEEIFSLCKKAGHSPEEVTLLAVVKEADIFQIKKAIEAGICDLGENKIQSAIVKYNAIRLAHNTGRVKWHLIGHLQSNKVKDAVKIFDLIHSVDSEHLAEEINKQAKKIDKIQDVLIQVNISGEKTKFGLKPDAAVEVIKKSAEFKNIKIKGLMTIAPLAGDPEEARSYFRKLHQLQDEVNGLRTTDYGLRVLSMGMSQDYKVAIEEGATIIRVGRGIFQQ